MERHTGYFPILYVNEKTVRAQIGIAVKDYEKHFGRKPRGIWLPECGYVPEADKYLREFGIEYAIVESHGILYADPVPIYRYICADYFSRRTYCFWS